MKVAIVYGSPQSLLSKRVAAPGIVVNKTLECIDSTELVAFSRWEPEVEEIAYDHTKYRCAKPIRLDRFVVRLMTALPYRWKKKLFGTTRRDSIETYVCLIRYVRAYRPQVIVVHVSYALVHLLRWACPRAKVIYYHHGSNMHVRLSGTEWRRLIRSANGGMIAVAEQAFTAVQAKYAVLPRRWKVIHNAVDPKQFGLHVRDLYRTTAREKLGLQNQVVFLYAGRISESKGLKHLVEAFGEVHRAYPNTHLVITGSAEMENWPERSFEQELRMMTEPFKDGVTFTGWLSNDELPKLVAAIDVGVLAAQVEEGIPLFLLECMACSVPVIATGLGGVPEIVENGTTGILIARQNIEQELVSAMLRYCADRALRHQHGKAAAEHVSTHHTYERVAAEFQNYLFTLEEALYA